MLGRGSGAIDAGAPFDNIEIDLDDPPLAPGQLDQRREIGLESLAEPSAARPHKHVLRGLHRDRAGPQQSAVPALVLLPGHLDRAPVEAECRQKRWSSLAITARISAGEMSSSGRQFLRMP